MIAVVHLVWGPYGAAPLRRFLSSYRQHPAGVEHELIVLFNGVDRSQRDSLAAELDGVEYRMFELDEPVQDLAAYARAATLLQHERVCFLNSHSVFLVSGWLLTMAQALDQSGAGLVGATGSWASVHSAVLNSFLLPNPYRGVVPKRKIARVQLLELELEREGMDTSPATVREQSSLGRSIRSTLKGLPGMPRQLLRFEHFPAHHVRTNAFMLERSLLADLRIGPLRSKVEAYEFESGRHSITRQVQSRGLRTLVVARDGAVYDQDRWPLSNTLWQGDQEGLLIADNQTRSYANGGIDRRRLLSSFAWGAQAAPRMPAGETSSGDDG
ncbi:MAG: hypothetical protein ACRDJX_07300 [Solirubrobacteraceae bacterium]